jgi:hypothetical protein
VKLSTWEGLASSLLIRGDQKYLIQVPWMICWVWGSSRSNYQKYTGLECLVFQRHPDVSEEHITSIFLVQGKANQNQRASYFCWFLPRLSIQPWRWRRYSFETSVLP